MRRRARKRGSERRGSKASRYYVGGRYLSTSSVGCVDSPVRVTQTSRLCNCANILAALYASSSVSYRFIAKSFLADTSHPVTTPDTSQCFQIRTSFAAGSMGAAGLSVIDSLGRGIAVFPGTHHGLQGSARRASEGFSVLLGRSMPFQELWGPPWGRPRPDNPYIATVSLCEFPCGLMCFLLDVVPLHRTTVLPCHLPPCHYTGNLTMLQNLHVILGRFRGNGRRVSHQHATA